MGRTGSQNPIGGTRPAIPAVAGVLLWLSAGAVTLIMAGCLSGTRVGDLAFSPDGQAVVYHRGEGSFFGIFRMDPPLLGVASGHNESCWVEVSLPDEVHRVSVLKQTLTPFSRSPPEEVDYRDAQPVFSPDSEHTAEVLLDSGEILIISRDGKHWKLPEAHNARTVTWASCEEVAYVEVVRKRGDDEFEGETHVVWRQRAFAPFTRRELCRREAYCWLKCCFSPPSGGNLLLHGVGRADWCWVADLASGEMVNLGPDGMCLESLAWSADGSKLFLAGRDPSMESLPSGKYRWTIYYTAFDTKTQRRSKWNETYETADDPRLILAPSWTADARYVILREPGRGWSLLDPWNQQRVPLAEKLAPHLEQAKAREVADAGPLPVSGWIWVRVHLREPPGAEGVFAMDYGGKHFVHLADGDSWAVSPDATYVAEGDEQGRVNIHTLSLPPGD